MARSTGLMISKTATHAIRALIYLAALPEGTFAGAGQIAREIDAPENYLGKLLQGFSRNGLVVSQKGHGGGFRLARDPDEITLFDIVEPLDQVARKTGCLLGQRRCSDQNGCSVHPRWKKVQVTYLDFLRETTLAEIAGGKRPEA
jgi:Rrf2 family transcriptional regulator, iron-sulfur cluster assembly transcription factor